MLYEAAEIGQRVERLLHANGAYRPLDWLLEAGRLASADLARWKGGEGNLRLADCLYGDPRVIGVELRTAAEHAHRLGLDPEKETLPAAAGHPPGLPDGWAETVWRKAPEPQLDMFFNGGGGRAHVLVRALKAADAAAAEAALGELERHEPGHPLVSGASRMIAALRGLPEDDAQAWAELDRVAEVAEAQLGQEAPAFLAPLWATLAQRLAQRLAEHPGSGIHPSAAWLRLGDWQAVADSLGPDPALVHGPELLARGLRAWHRLGDEPLALRWLFHLCWRYPEMGEEIERLTDRELGLETALDEWDRRELAEAWGWEHFPAWLLLHGYAGRDLGASDPRVPEYLPQLHRLLASPEDMAAREALHAIAPELLREFLKSR